MTRRAPIVLFREESWFCAGTPSVKEQDAEDCRAEHTGIVMKALVLRDLVGEENDTDRNLVLDTNPQIPRIGDAVVRNSNWE